jgi:F420-dependent methylenetetrahydromethanopterin dehydrogenase
MRSAAVLCDEARELEKAGDCILRQAHKKDGTLVKKTKLVAKLGNIASGVMAELLLDERADREDMQTFMATSGTKLQPEDIERVVSNMKAWKPDFCIVVSPNGVLPGPTGAREDLAKAGIPVIIITDDVTTKKEWEEVKASKFGYIIMKADSMIGARREFLDPVEMADFNGNLVKVLAGTGAFRKLQLAVDKVIDQVKAGKKGEDRAPEDRHDHREGSRRRIHQQLCTCKGTCSPRDRHGSRRAKCQGLLHDQGMGEVHPDRCRRSRNDEGCSNPL